MSERDEPGQDEQEMADLDLDAEEGEEVAEQVRGGARRVISPT